MDLDTTGLDFHFTTSQVIASLLFSVIGIYLFRLGKKTASYSLAFTSIALMVYPMFTTGWLQDWGVGLLLCGLAYYFHNYANLTG